MRLLRMCASLIASIWMLALALYRTHCSTPGSRLLSRCSTVSSVTPTPGHAQPVSQSETITALCTRALLKSQLVMCIFSHADCRFQECHLISLARLGANVHITFKHEIEVLKISSPDMKGLFYIDF